MSAHFGIDISSNSIKVAEAKNVSNGYELQAFGEVRTPASLQSSNSQDEGLIAKSIKQLIRDSGIKNRNVYMALPENQVYTRVIQLPLLKEEELKNALKFEAEQYVPIPIDEVFLEYQTLYAPPSDIKGAKMEVLIVAARKTIVEKLTRIAQMADLTPLVAETSLLATLRAVKEQMGDFSMLVDLGNSSTDIAIIQSGNVKQVSSIPTAGHALTRAVAQALSLPEQQARQYKHTYGLEENQLEGKVARAMEEPITIIVNHIEKNVRFAKELSKDGSINQVVISGGTALLSNLTFYLVDKIGIEVNLANPLQACINENLPSQLVAAGPRFASVIGLAIRD